MFLSLFLICRGRESSLYIAIPTSLPLSFPRPPALISVSNNLTFSLNTSVIQLKQLSLSLTGLPIQRLTITYLRLHCRFNESPSAVALDVDILISVSQYRCFRSPRGGLPDSQKSACLERIVDRSRHHPFFVDINYYKILTESILIPPKLLTLYRLQQFNENYPITAL